MDAFIFVGDEVEAFFVGDRDPLHALGILRLPGVAKGCGAQALYLPTLGDIGAAPVPDDGDAVLDLTLVQHRPERQFPPVRLQERLVLDR